MWQRPILLWLSRWPWAQRQERDARLRRHLRHCPAGGGEAVHTVPHTPERALAAHPQATAISECFRTSHTQWPACPELAELSLTAIKFSGRDTPDLRLRDVVRQRGNFKLWKRVLDLSGDR